MGMLKPLRWLEPCVRGHGVHYRVYCYNCAPLHPGPAHCSQPLIRVERTTIYTETENAIYKPVKATKVALPHCVAPQL